MTEKSGYQRMWAEEHDKRVLMLSGRYTGPLVLNAPVKPSRRSRGWRRG